PFLAMISTTFRRGEVLTGVLAFLAYALGMALTVGVAAMAVALLGSSATGTIRRILPHINRIGGTLVLITGLYVVYYGYYEIRLFFAGGSADDPIIGAAGAVQGWLSDRVDVLGAWPLVGILVMFVAVALLWRVRTRRRSRPAVEEASTPA
nr:cytochrome c biogenesis protein CcdA [Actinomycetes bacterium]